MTNLKKSYGEQTAPTAYPNPKGPTQSEAAALPEVTAVSPISESLERKVTAALTKKKEIVGRRQTTKSRTEPSPGPAPQTDAGRHPLSAKRDKDALPAPLQVIPRRRFPFGGPRNVDPRLLSRPQPQ